MAPENVPSYLREVLQRTDPERLRQFAATGDGLSQEDAREVVARLGEWVEDSEYWSAFARSAAFPPPPPGQELDPFLEEELQVLTDALDGDEALARDVLLELPSRVSARRPNPQQAQQAVVEIRVQVNKIQVAPQAPPSHRLRVARALRRAFKAACGGASIAADLTVLPDPTMILRAVSIALGCDAIIDAVRPDLS